MRSKFLDNAFIISYMLSSFWMMCCFEYGSTFTIPVQRFSKACDLLTQNIHNDHKIKMSSIMNIHTIHYPRNHKITTRTGTKVYHATTSDDDSSSSVIERLNLSSQFSRWKTLQDILEEEDKPTAQDVNEILYLVLKSFLDHPRPRKLPNGDTNPSPLLNDEQRDLLVTKLFDGDRKSIGALPMDENGNDSFEYGDEKIIGINNLLEKFQPDRKEDEDAFKSCWDLVIELYGREATKMSEQSEDNRSWKVRSGIVRLLIHFDFLSDGVEGHHNHS